MVEAVADAGPLIHLAEVGRFSLVTIFERLHIPQAVWNETVGQNRVAETGLMGLSQLERHTLDEQGVAHFVQANGLEKLHLGEQEGLYLCQQTGANLILTDDLAVRKAARSLHLTPVGSLGIVVRAYQAGGYRLTLTEAEQILWALQDTSTLFVTRAIVELAIEELRRRAGSTG
jgi:predicted nucleic acid-binding protein